MANGRSQKAMPCIVTDRRPNFLPEEPIPLGVGRSLSTTKLRQQMCLLLRDERMDHNIKIVNFNIHVLSCLGFEPK